MTDSLKKKRQEFSFAVGSLLLDYTELVACGEQEKADKMGKAIDKLCVEWLKVLQKHGVGKSGD